MTDPTTLPAVPVKRDVMRAHNIRATETIGYADREKLAAFADAHLDARLRAIRDAAKALRVYSLMEVLDKVLAAGAPTPAGDGGSAVEERVAPGTTESPGAAACTATSCSPPQAHDPARGAAEPARIPVRFESSHPSGEAPEVLQVPNHFILASDVDARVLHVLRELADLAGARHGGRDNSILIQDVSMVANGHAERAPADPFAGLDKERLQADQQMLREAGKVQPARNAPDLRPGLERAIELWKSGEEDDSGGGNFANVLRAEIARIEAAGAVAS